MKRALMTLILLGSFVAQTANASDDIFFSDENLSLSTSKLEAALSQQLDTTVTELSTSRTFGNLIFGSAHVKVFIVSFTMNSQYEVECDLFLNKDSGNASLYRCESEPYAKIDEKWMKISDFGTINVEKY